MPDLAFTRRGALGFSASALAALMSLSACSGPAKSHTDFAPLFARLGEIVIPTTDTPGAGIPHVFAFISRAAEASFLDAPDDLFEQLQTALDDRAGGDFMGLAKDEQAALVAAYDRDSYASLQKRWAARLG